MLIQFDVRAILTAFVADQGPFDYQPSDQILRLGLSGGAPK